MKITTTLLLAALAIAACSPIRPDDGSTGNMPMPSEITQEGAVSPDLAVTPGPPGVPLQPPAGDIRPEGWQTFTSLMMDITLDYPADWQIEERPERLTFISPAGAAILLERSPAGKSVGQGCTNLVNAYGQMAEVCAADASGRYSATFDLTLADGTTQRFVLSTADAQVLETYKSMLNSLRPA
jgi:hypothetical protein